MMDIRLLCEMGHMCKACSKLPTRAVDFVMPIKRRKVGAKELPKERVESKALFGHYRLFATLWEWDSCWSRQGRDS